MNLERRSRIDRLIGLLESAREETGRLVGEAEDERQAMEGRGGEEYVAASSLRWRLGFAETSVRMAIAFLREAKGREE